MTDATLQTQAQLSLEGIDPIKTKRKYSKRKPFVKEITKRILHAVGNGLRTADSIANATGITKAKVQSNLWHLKDRGLVHSTKKDGQAFHKYYLTTEKPTLDGTVIDIVPKKAKRKATKRVVRVGKVVKVEKVVTEKVAQDVEEFVRNLENQVTSLNQRLANYEMAFAEKEKEVWLLESEIHDLKAIVRYLENKGA